MNDLFSEHSSKTDSHSYLDNKLLIEIHPANLNSNGRSIGHILIRTDDPQKRSFDGSYPLGISMSNATVITRSNNPGAVSDNGSHKKLKPYMTVNNELRVNFLPDKNADESSILITSPWGDVKDRVRFSTGMKHSISELMECVIYAFIIAIVFRYLFFSAFFIPSQSMQNTLDIGDKIIANKLIYHLRNPVNQEVVIFKTYSPKDRMSRFHLEDSIHFDPMRNLKNAENYKTAKELMRAIVDPSFRDDVEVRNNALYVNNLCLGFPEIGEEPGKLYIDDRFFATGEITDSSVSIADQFLGSLYIAGNRLVLGDNFIDVGQIDIFNPMGYPGYVQYNSRIPTNPIVDAFKAGFFKLVGKRPQLLVGENQIIGDLMLKSGDWRIYNQDLDINLSHRPMRFPLPFQGRGGSRIEIGKLYIENGVIVLKENEQTLKVFGEPVLRDDVAIINGQILGWVGKNRDGFTVNGMPLTDLWETRDFIKRCIAIPGDEIRIEEGKVFINGQPLVEPYLDEENMRYDDYGPEIIPADRYFMMGDNRNNSKDSRVVGPIHRENIKGRALFVFWPPGRIKLVQ